MQNLPNLVGEQLRKSGITCPAILEAQARRHLQTGQGYSEKLQRIERVKAIGLTLLAMLPLYIAAYYFKHENNYGLFFLMSILGFLASLFSLHAVKSLSIAAVATALVGIAAACHLLPLFAGIGFTLGIIGGGSIPERTITR